MVLKDRAAGSTGLSANLSNLYTNAAFGNVGITALQGDIIRPINQNVVEVFYDKLFNLRPETEAGLVVKAKVRIGRKVSYPPAAPTSVDPVNGSYHIIFAIIEQDSTPRGDTVIATMFARTFFKDESGLVWRN
jgi:hypothetical protein